MLSAHVLKLQMFNQQRPEKLELGVGVYTLAHININTDINIGVYYTNPEP